MAMVCSNCQLFNKKWFITLW